MWDSTGLMGFIWDYAGLYWIIVGLYTLVLNIATENGPFIDDVRIRIIKPSIFKGFSMVSSNMAGWKIPELNGGF